jgi:hypothetical protein
MLALIADGARQPRGGVRAAAPPDAVNAHLANSMRDLEIRMRVEASGPGRSATSTTRPAPHTLKKTGVDAGDVDPISLDAEVRPVGESLLLALTEPISVARSDEITCKWRIQTYGQHD